MAHSLSRGRRREPAVAHADQRELRLGPATSRTTRSCRTRSTRPCRQSGLVLPHDSLNGLVQTWLVYLSATSRPFDPVTFNAKYRFYDYSDYSRKMHVPERRRRTTARSSPRARPGAGAIRSRTPSSTPGPASSRSSPSRPVSAGSGGTATSTARCRSVTSTSARSPSTRRPPSGCLARVSYTPSFRRISEYNTRAHAEHSVAGGPAAAARGRSEPAPQKVRRGRPRSAEGRRRSSSSRLVTSSRPRRAAALPLRQLRQSSALGLQQETGWVAGIDLELAPARARHLLRGLHLRAALPEDALAQPAGEQRRDARRRRLRLGLGPLGHGADGVCRRQGGAHPRDARPEDRRRLLRPRSGGSTRSNPTTPVSGSGVAERPPRPSSHSPAFQDTLRPGRGGS